MKTRLSNILTLVLTLVVLQVNAHAQSEQSRIPATLDAFLEIALKGDPEIRRVEAEAEAALALRDGTRFKVAEELSAMYIEREKLIAKIVQNKRAHDEAARRGDDVGRTLERFKVAELDLKKIERLLLAKLRAAQYGSTGTSTAQGFNWSLSVPGTLTSPSSPASNLEPAPRPQYPDEVDDQLHSLLESQVSITFEDIEIRDLLDYVNDSYELNFNIDAALSAAKITLNLRNINLHAALLAVTENAGNLCFVFRDYGLFVTTPERAATMNAPTIPANIPLLVPSNTDEASTQP